LLGHQVFHPAGDHPLGGILVTLVRFSHGLQERELVKLVPFLFYLVAMFYVYVLQSLKDGTTYIGYTEDVETRLKLHNAGKTKSIKHKLPFRLVHTEEFISKTDARKRELQLKNNSWVKEQLYKQIFPQDSVRS
jgi:putative endonuclease